MVYFFEALLAGMSIVIFWFTGYVIYRLITDKS
ncbi:hypothetical protein CCUG60885_04904 [Mycobacteroides salmoniphilum]|uniref:Uncharacterized protein n=1 Tax=Mycobacteroides salmoniphilum TaxID=404941 RepID=A0A4R8SAA5_9MYCO|nr:hypothetical protein CCUG60885_04904 [Mycobacteroides salmoniphilum]TEA00224.1 hypothetical protein CCUG60883_04907 [Mycobacteroides salmoniphilum]